MEDDELRKTSMSISLLMLQLYGQKSYTEIKNYQDIALVKKHYLKVLNTLLITIEQTIQVVDKNQINTLREIIEFGKSLITQCKEFSEIDQQMITTLAKVSFQLIGNLPYRTAAKNVDNKKVNWEFNSCRQIQYVQTVEQKANLIKDVVYRKYLNRFGTWFDFLDFYSIELKKNPQKLLDYMKEKHPDIYEEIE
jgi:hypothetical protein